MAAMAVATPTRPYALAKYAGRTVFHYSGPLTIKADAEQTAGALGVIEYIAPTGVTVPTHLHSDEDESIYVLAGQLTVDLDGAVQQVGVGGYVFMPRNVPHGWAVAGDDPARILIIWTPGGFEEALAQHAALEANLGEDEQLDPAEVGALFGRYGIESPC